MEKETKIYVGSINNNPKSLKTITIEINRFLINRELINLLIIMYTQWRKDEGSSSYSQTLIIPCLSHF